MSSPKSRKLQVAIAILIAAGGMLTITHYPEPAVAAAKPAESGVPKAEPPTQSWSDEWYETQKSLIYTDIWDIPTF